LKTITMPKEILVSAPTVYVVALWVNPPLAMLAILHPCQRPTFRVRAHVLLLVCSYLVFAFGLFVAVGMEVDIFVSIPMRHSIDDVDVQPATFTRHECLTFAKICIRFHYSLLHTLVVCWYN
jgi:hypothetical protein